MMDVLGYQLQQMHLILILIVLALLFLWYNGYILAGEDADAAKEGDATYRSRARRR